VNPSRSRSEQGAAAERPLFRKLLIANRGEIACRIGRTAREMRIATVAIHHGVEARSKHVAEADQAVEITGETPVAAHLDGKQIVEAARDVGADAVHPGYGFLSENAAFARMVVDAGLTFIGPDAATIALMGDKISARAFAEDNGIPVAPSVPWDGDLARFATAASKVGFPLLIKAAAGGGGKGMSIVRSAEQLEEAARLAASEARHYFADDRIYAEVYVERPRHIEIQVLGDGKGNVIHLFERECSVQRRFQKIIEEAPAPTLPGDLRGRICEAAVRLTSAAKYKNAGTVEFILGADGRFFFLEMNTRLQVEHPVTEMTAGVDLVRAQIEIAAGGGLPFLQKDVHLRGHAIECRICAEDPDRGFMPETGVIHYLGAPEEPYVRFENALSVGQKVGSEFDSLLAKLVVQGSNREEAIARSLAALKDLAILGVRTNAEYLTRVLNHPAFAAGDLHTGFVSEHGPDLASAKPDAAILDRVAIAAALGFREFCDQAFAVPEPYATMGHWRN
jgi:acetyl/propionyl-CoA carboxylase alpha subunit